MSLCNRVAQATTSSGAHRCGNDVVETHASRRPGHASRARSTVIACACAVVTVIATAVLATPVSASAATPAPEVRVNQVGYPTNGPKAAFAQQQLNFALGANAWGSSFVVGAGTVFPHCMQSEIANLAGSLTGRGDIQLGATTDGPSSIGNFAGLGTVAGMRACSAGQFAPFNTTTAGYEDNVVSWPSVEPAADYTAASLFAFALAGDQGSGLG